MLRTYDGAVAIVTGGASGIGRALAEALAERGATVVLADLQIELAREVAASLVAAGRTASAAQIDVTDFAAVDRLVQETAATHGRLDYIFNNAGIGIGGEVRHYQLEDWNRVFAVNLHGVANGVQAAFPVMLKQGFGHIVNTASIAGPPEAPPNWPAPRRRSTPGAPGSPPAPSSPASPTNSGSSATTPKATDWRVIM